MNPITLDAIRLLTDLQHETAMVSKDDKELAAKIVTKLLRFIDNDIEAVLEKNSKFLK